jgi:hypothetical protein
MFGFLRVKWSGDAFINGAESAITGAYFTHDHESSRAVRKAKSYIRAVSAFTDGVEL